MCRGDLQLDTSQSYHPENMSINQIIIGISSKNLNNYIFEWYLN